MVTLSPGQSATFTFWESLPAPNCFWKLVDLQLQPGMKSVEIA